MFIYYRMNNRFYKGVYSIVIEYIKVEKKGAY